MAYDYTRVQVRRESGVAWATLDNPPINLFTAEFYIEVAKFVAEVAVDDTVRCVVLQSANPEFFIAHFDVELILKFPVEGEAARDDELTRFAQMCETLRTMGKATLIKLAGRVGGGGSELALSADMRFGVLGKTVVNQMEVPIGILPGGTGTQRLPRLMGRSRALEVILGGIDLDAATAERWGYLNRAFASVEEMDAYVDALAVRIAGFPSPAVARAKAAVLAAEPDWHEGLVEEAYQFQELLRTPQAAPAMRRFLELGGQTREGELAVGELNGRVGNPGTG
ncbi:MAG: enoyl-CoA hydratase/isomerase family protein [Acidimicrobiia bacterium]|nr:enoyl-CoA hydratase/isomerase family protein [Acidimicrobiia bacterium]